MAKLLKGPDKEALLSMALAWEDRALKADRRQKDKDGKK
jgi:hypothetical protein